MSSHRIEGFAGLQARADALEADHTPACISHFRIDCHQNPSACYHRTGVDGIEGVTAGVDGLEPGAAAGSGLGAVGLEAGAAAGGGPGAVSAGVEAVPPTASPGLADRFPTSATRSAGMAR